MLMLPENWMSFVVRDPAGNSLLSGTGSRQADLSTLAPGRYSLTSPESNKRFEVIRSDKIPGGVLLATPGTSSTQFSFGTSTDAGPFFVSVKDAAGAVQQSFYVYAPEVEITFPSGNWNVNIAKPGESGFGFAVQIGAAGQLERLDRIGLVNRADWFLESLSFGSKINDVVVSTGPRMFEFNDSVNAQHVVQVRDPQTGTISNYFTQSKDLRVPLGLGAFEWRVLGIVQSSIVYPTLIEGLNNVQGGWTPFTSRLANSTTAAGLFVPGDMLNFVVRTPEGNSVIGDTLNNWIDLSTLQSGRYSLTGQGLNGFIREELIVNSSIIGGALSLRAGGDGSLRVAFHDETPAAYYVSVKKGDGTNITAFYNYASVVNLQLEDGDYLISVAESGSAGFSFKTTLSGGNLSAVDNVETRDKVDWYMDSLTRGDPFGPINTNNGPANFSFDAGTGGNYIVQVRDPVTGSVGSYKSSTPNLDIPTGLGEFQWRSFGLPVQLDITADVIGRISATQGGWTSFDQVSETPEKDYVLGREPDKVSRVEDLIFNYPADALLLDDGSIVVTNSYGASVIRIMPNGTLQRLAGGDREGYVESGSGRDVLLRGPGQLFDNKDGTILFTDTRNFVVREINIDTGQVRTLFGNPDVFQPTIVNGQITGLGDIYDVGRDNLGRLFITAASTVKFGDQQYSSNTNVLRQNGVGDWYIWEPDTSGLIAGSFKFVDMIFHNDIVSVLVHDGSDKKYLKYSETGELLGQVNLGVSFGGGLALDPTTGNLLIGNHTSLIRLNWETLEATDYPFPETFANVSFMNFNGVNLALVDSDRGRVYNYNVQSGQILSTIGLSTNISNVIVDLESTDNGLLALDNQTPRIISLNDGKITSIAGTGFQGVAGAGSTASQTSFYYPNAISKGKDGSIYVVDANHRVMKISPEGVLSTFAGGVDFGFSGDGGAATNARFQSIYGVEAADDGKVYIADSYNHAIRVVGVDGTVTTLAGNGQQGLGFMQGTASLNVPLRVTVTSGGRILISDSWNNRIVEMAGDGSLVPVAGIGYKGPYQGTGDFSGDGGLATEAELNTPVGLAMYDADGTLFIADSFNNRIRYVDSAGNIHTLIGGDRGYAFGQLLNLPSDVALVGDDLFIADTGNALVLKLVGVDRTGNDFANSLDVGTAITRSRFASRFEYVSSDDADFYNLAGYDNGLITITAAQSGLTIKFSNGAGGYYGERILTAGQSVDIDADEHNYLIVSASEKQKYTMTFGQSLPMISNNAVVAMVESREFKTSTFDPRLSLMVQAMASFADGSGISSNRFEESKPIFDYFA